MDTASLYFKLMYLLFRKYVEKPCFQHHLKDVHQNKSNHGFTLYYTNQCPFTAKYVPLLEDIAKKRNIDFRAAHILTKEQAQNSPTPFTTFSLFYNDEFITHELLSENKFKKILTEKIYKI